MLNFTFYAPTKILFGQNQISHLAAEILNYGDKVMLVYGKQSIKKNGIYNSVIEQLNANNISFCELSGVDPNPRISSVIKGAQLCRENGVKMVLAVGGGSVIDCSKAIAFAALYDGDPWDFWLGKHKIERALPLGAVLTVAATGSEMNSGSVITNEQTEDKIGKGDPHLYPKFSILDPANTFSVPKYHTAAGVADIIAHIFEYYFSPVTTAFLQDCFAEAVIKTCIKYAPIAIKEPQNYEARANLMWASTMALNGVTGRGKSFEGILHGIEHVLSGFYDITHGVGLAIIMPPWMKYALCDETLPIFVRYATNVWCVTGSSDMQTALMGIDKTIEFFESLDIPLKLSAVGIDNSRFNEIAERTVPNETRGVLKKLTRDDIVNILNSSL